MKPAPKYQAAMTLYRLGDRGIWEHRLFGVLRQHYRDSELSGLREDLIGMSTVGWLDTLEQLEHRGQILRCYRLAASARPLIEYQLNLETYRPSDLSSAGISIESGLR
ncbi:hypothetical protein [Rhodococcus rhodochrous]|nr:hypothetical protein [Rhodococcus rhodochrous]